MRNNTGDMGHMPATLSETRRAEREAIRAAIAGGNNARVGTLENAVIEGLTDRALRKGVKPAEIEHWLDA